MSDPKISLASPEDVRAVWDAWGGFIVACGRLYEPRDVEGLVLAGGAGLVTWRVEGTAAEIVTLDAFPPGRGHGAKLLAAAEEELALRGVRRVRLVTTNENVRALAFYQRHGWRLVRVHLDFMTRVFREKPHLLRTAGEGPARLDAWELDKPLPRAVHVRSEGPADAAGVRALLREAFPTPVEADLVDALRGSRDELVSLVAASGEDVLGHVLVSRGRLGDRSVACVAPVAVRERARRRGIAGRLVREALARCRRARETVAAVLGDPAYYGRFGFRAEPAIGCAYEEVPVHFQVLALSEGALEGLRGRVDYPEAFARLGV